LVTIIMTHKRQTVRTVTASRVPPRNNLLCEMKSDFPSQPQPSETKKSKQFWADVRAIRMSQTAHLQQQFVCIDMFPQSQWTIATTPSLAPSLHPSPQNMFS
jgi:hypothetical protein